jgi:uncharacterized membrane protein YobD (UPF0266 family)
MKARKESHMPSDREWNEAQERANSLLSDTKAHSLTFAALLVILCNRYKVWLLSLAGSLALTLLLLIAMNIAWIECSFFPSKQYGRTSICSYYANTWTEGSALFTFLCGIIIAGVVGIVTLEKR